MRITVVASSHFLRSKSNLKIEINEQFFNATYTQKEGRSDLLRIGKAAMSLLGLKAGGRLKFTKISIENFKIEKDNQISDLNKNNV